MSKNMLEALQGISGESESKNLVEAIDKIAEGGGSGGDNVFVVHATYPEADSEMANGKYTTLDASGLQILDAVNAGKLVIIFMPVLNSEQSDVVHDIAILYFARLHAYADYPPMCAFYTTGPATGYGLHIGVSVKAGDRVNVL